jgi:hypothetical protein
MGIFSGVIAGGLTAGFGQSVSPNFVLFSILLISAFVSFTILRGLTEAIESLYGTIIGGAIAGAAAGYLSLRLLHS